MALMYDVVEWVYRGIERKTDDFFLALSPSQIRQWQEAAARRSGESVAAAAPAMLTNPLLNRRLQRIADADSGTATYHMFEELLQTARCILTQGVDLRQHVELGLLIRSQRDAIDYDSLRDWLSQLRMQRIAKLEADLLIGLFCFSPEEIKFADGGKGRDVGKNISDMFRATKREMAEWYFTQGKNVFVSTNNSGAMIWHVRHSMKYMRYYPMEAVTNFMANFAHSLSHIEE